ncbi:MAG: hypothetical protein EPN21_15000, partial [Methylococcaceae bacterium]
HAFSPDGKALAAGAGDLWFGPKPELIQGLTPGSYGYLTFLHELGHALGLIHPHDAAPAYAADAGADSLKYSVMSYRDYAGDDLGGYNSGYYPTSPMLNDVAALQYLYGANAGFNAGDNSYSWAPEKSVYETLWDSGGIDTIDASSQRLEVKIDLNAAQWSEIGAPFNNGQGFVRDCLTIARGVVIENAKGSRLDDVLIGNAAANTLTGNGGNDALQGGGGADTAVYSGSLNQYSIALLDVASQTLTIKDNNPTNGDDGMDTLSGVEKLQFADKTITVASLIPAVNIGDVTVKEGQGGQLAVNVPVTLTAKSNQTVTVSFTTQDAGAVAGSDYAAQKGTLTFAPGETQKNIQIPVKGDTVVETDEALKISLKDAVNALLGDKEATVTLQNDDQPALSIAALSVAENLAGGVVTLSVQLTSASQDTITVDYGTLDGSAKAGSDYKTSSGTLTFAPGETQAIISVPISDDALVESDEAFGVRLSNPLNAVLGTPATATVTIQNDDAYLFSIGGNLAFPESDAVAVITVKLSQAAPDFLYVDYKTQAVTATAGDDYTES